MSALRVPGPDGRVRLVVIDDGAVGRVTTGRTVYGAFPSSQDAPQRPVAPAQPVRRPKKVPLAVCGRVMARGAGQCGRTAGHRNACRSRAWMDAKARRMRKSA